MSLAHSPSIVTNGLILCLDAANVKSYPGSGTNWYDLSGNNRNGTLTNGPSYNTTNGGILTFDGVNDYIDCGSVPAIGNSLIGLTVSVWLYTTSSSTRCIVENGTTYTTNTFYLFQENASNFTFSVYGGAYDVVFSNYAYQLNTWYNLVGVWSSGTRNTLYTNGVDTSGTRGGSVQTAVINGNTNLMVGSRAGSQYHFQGSIASVIIYNRALTQTEVTKNFNAHRGRYGI